MLTFEVNIVLVRDREEIIALVAFDRSDIGSVGFAKGDLDAARKKKRKKKRSTHHHQCQFDSVGAR